MSTAFKERINNFLNEDLGNGREKDFYTYNIKNSPYPSQKTSNNPLSCK